jgi:hypothetical protein
VSPPIDSIEDDEAVEVVDGLPVLASDDGRTAVSYARPASAPLSAVPKRQVLALAASSFLAGAATLALMHARKGVKVQPRRLARPSGFGEIVGSERFLLDVHRLHRP